MKIEGIQSFEFGVDDLAAASQFLSDFGLSERESSSTRAVYRTLNAAEIHLDPVDAPDLPPGFEEGPTLRRMTWAAADQETLAGVRARMAGQPGFRESAAGVECRDPNGMTVRVAPSTLEPVTLSVPAINQYGDIRRVDEPSPVYEQAQPVGIGHAVFFVEDLEATEKFYVDTLGFVVSDRYTGRGVFLRQATRGGHHNLFLLHLPNKPRGLNHVAFTVRDIHEVIGGGLHMNRQNWSTFIGPGRHPISSAYFWYVNSPLGGAFEYYTNEDFLTENWVPRVLEHSLESFTEWAIEGGIDADTRRQKKATS